MLRDLEAARATLGVAAYGLSVTTLEEVFLLLSGAGGGSPEDGRGSPEDGASSPPADRKRSAGGGGTDEGESLRAPLLGAGAGAGEARGGGPPEEPARLSGAALYWQQLRALAIKRALCARWAAACGFSLGLAAQGPGRTPSAQLGA
jgi:hypothetical protein